MKVAIGDMQSILHLLTSVPLPAIRAEGFLEVIRFFTTLILNADETHLLE